MPENVAQIEAHRTALTGHCYRMLGSTVDADDAVHETLIRAWRSLDRFDERASLRTWLYRIATNVCLDALADRRRRERPMAEGCAGRTCDRLSQRPREHWIEPIADARSLPLDADPAELAMLRQSIRLAFVAALQDLAPKQRAVLLLTEVLGWSEAEVAETLDTSIATVNSALQCARATLTVRTESDPKVLSESQTQLFNRYASKRSSGYEVDTLASLLREGCGGVFYAALYAMAARSGVDSGLAPGSWSGVQRITAVADRGLRIAGVRAIPGGSGGRIQSLWALIVLELSGDQIAEWNCFLDTQILFPKFGTCRSVCSNKPRFSIPSMSGN